MKGLLLFVIGGICGAIAMFVLMASRPPMQRIDENTVRPPPIVESAPASNPASTPPPAATSPVVPAVIAPAVSVPTSMPASTPVDLESGALATPENPGLVSPRALLIPVDGIGVGQLTDTFGNARSAGKSHDAIDIMAPRGTRVLAAADGKVVKLFTSVRGGLTVYEFDPGATFAYYYAHLDSYAPGLAEGKQLERGDLIGFVGSTGDASPDAPHLHFSIFVLGPEKHWWQGTAINPYPILSGRQSMPPAGVAAQPNLH